uniref:Uncharacterized protein n=1 Tax=Octopus bimaculoides TaxID=37653 RepID=A0A0L8IEC9_OCTBM
MFVCDVLVWCFLYTIIHLYGLGLLFFVYFVFAGNVTFVLVFCYLSVFIIIWHCCVTTI